MPSGERCVEEPANARGSPPVSKSVQLLVSGLISADITFRVGEMPRRAEKYRADDVRFSLGGGGAIAAAALKCQSSDGLDGIPEESAVVAFQQLHGVEPYSG